MKKRFSSDVCKVESGCSAEGRLLCSDRKKGSNIRIMYPLPMNAIYTASDLGISFNEVSNMARD